MLRWGSWCNSFGNYGKSEKRSVSSCPKMVRLKSYQKTAW